MKRPDIELIRVEYRSDSNFARVVDWIYDLETRCEDLLTAVEALRDAQAAFMLAVQTGALRRTETNAHHAERAFMLHELAMALAEKVRYFGELYT